MTQWRTASLVDVEPFCTVSAQPLNKGKTCYVITSGHARQRGWKQKGERERTGARQGGWNASYSVSNALQGNTGEWIYYENKGAISPSTHDKTIEGWYVLDMKCNTSVKKIILSVLFTVFRRCGQPVAQIKNKHIAHILLKYWIFPSPLPHKSYRTFSTIPEKQRVAAMGQPPTSPPPVRSIT